MRRAARRNGASRGYRSVPAVPRERLTRRFAAEPEAPLAIVTAPSGYGKTTALAQWDAVDDREFVWVPVDRRHDDVTLLIGAIAVALDRVEPLGDRVFAPLMAPHPNLWRVLIPRLSEALQDGRRPFVLVLDDLHRVDDPEAFEALAAVAEQLPIGSRIAIASREGLDVPIGRLRTQRGVIELGARDMAMTRRETELLLAGLGIRLADEQLAELTARTEGWPAGILMAALAIEDADDVAAALEQFCGDGRFVSDYLREEFVSKLSVEQFDFLTRVVALDRPTAALCDAVLERDDSREVLRGLAHSNLLLSPLDHRETEFRVHSLLREMLIAEPGGPDAGERARLHGRASAWYSERGDIEEGIAHAIAAGDRRRAADLVWAHAATLQGSGRTAVVQRWLGEFTDAEVAASPPLCLATATVAGTLGDGATAEHWADKALDALGDEDHRDAELLRVEARMVRASVAARAGLEAMRDEAESSYALLPEASPWRALCCLIAGVARHLTGDRDRARQRLEEGVRRGRTAIPNLGALSLTQLALCSLDDGDIEHAAELSAKAMETVEHFGLGEDPTTALVVATAALCDAHHGSADRGHARARQAVALLERLNGVSAWYEAETRVVVARTLILLDDAGEARARLAEAGRFMHSTPDGTVLREWIAAGWKEADAANSVTGRWPLSPAELRLLHYLPTHLSFREIAAEVFVSPNTVKTQARSIYRKLGVSSRAEAVDCARTAGLLEYAEFRAPS